MSSAGGSRARCRSDMERPADASPAPTPPVPRPPRPRCRTPRRVLAHSCRSSPSCGQAGFKFHKRPSANFDGWCRYGGQPLRHPPERKPADPRPVPTRFPTGVVGAGSHPRLSGLSERVFSELRGRSFPARTQLPVLRGHDARLGFC
jgi:hypothetical protein